MGWSTVFPWLQEKCLVAGLWLFLRLILVIIFTGLPHYPPHPKSTSCITQPWGMWLILTLGPITVPYTAWWYSHPSLKLFQANFHHKFLLIAKQSYLVCWSTNRIHHQPSLFNWHYYGDWLILVMPQNAWSLYAPTSPFKKIKKKKIHQYHMPLQTEVISWHP